MTPLFTLLFFNLLFNGRCTRILQTQGQANFMRVFFPLDQILDLFPLLSHYLPFKLHKVKKTKILCTFAYSAVPSRLVCTQPMFCLLQSGQQPQKYRTGGGARPVCEPTFKSLLKCSPVMRGLREVICSLGIIV